MSDIGVDDGLRASLDQFRGDFERLRAEVGKVIVGQVEILDDTLIALIAGGHVLLEACRDSARR
jgi:MoxR-like ATPase